MGAISSTDMNNKQVIALFIVGLALLLAAFWAGLTVIKDQANPTKPGAAKDSETSDRDAKAAPAARQPEQPASDETKFIVSVAEFGTLTQAKQLEADLKARKYFSARVETSSQDTLYHVTIGPHDKPDADRIANELSGEGRKGVMILPWKGN
jgi:cell division septation protein DedD